MHVRFFTVWSPEGRWKPPKEKRRGREQWLNSPSEKLDELAIDMSLNAYTLFKKCLHFAQNLKSNRIGHELLMSPLAMHSPRNIK